MRQVLFNSSFPIEWPEIQKGANQFVMFQWQFHQTNALPEFHCVQVSKRVSQMNEMHAEISNGMKSRTIRQIKQYVGRKKIYHLQNFINKIPSLPGTEMSMLLSTLSTFKFFSSPSSGGKSDSLLLSRYNFSRSGNRVNSTGSTW